MQKGAVQGKSSGMKKQEYDYLAKIVIIGNSAVGKSNLLLRFVEQKYVYTHTPTIGLDFRSKVLVVPLKGKKGKKKLKLQLWDTAGQQKFRTLTDTYFKGASGIIICYSINDRRSYQDVASWVTQLEENGAENTPKIIVGNKCDLREERVVSSEEGRLLAAQNNCTFMEVSAKEDINVNQLFTQLSMTVIDKLQTELQQMAVPNERRIQKKLSNIMINQPGEKKKNCC